jgi:c-di-AMP phosphodiesterase-like protein
MELPEYNIGKRYAEIIEMVWFTYFYASLIPIGAILSLIGASLFYWIDKYNLLRKSSVKQTISEDFSMRALIMLDLTLILKPVGEIVFDMQIRGEWNYQSASLIFIGFVYVLIPKDALLNWING